MDPLIVLFGLGVGLLVGTTGVGGGSVMTPVLILAFGIKPVLAVGTDLAYGAITKTVGGWQHLRQGTVSMRIALWLAVGSIPSSSTSSPLSASASASGSCWASPRSGAAP
jgi:uncharacterized protein